jgi:hypothetical protein
VRPRLLDLFAGAGGAAMGYHRAGFDVVGVDIAPQPHYPFEFHQADALECPLDGYDAVHASPPCQAHSKATAWRGDRLTHPELIAPTRRRLQRCGVPWVIENVPQAPIRRDYLLCGSAFGIAVQRHRAFETSWGGFGMVNACRHQDLLPFMHKGERAFADAMGCSWMTVKEAREAIPPAYTEFIGAQLLDHLTHEKATA